MVEYAIEFCFVPFWYRYVVLASRQAVPDVLDELESLRRRELEDLVEELLGSHTI